MKLSVKWLRRFLPGLPEAAVLSERFTMTGSKVETVDVLGGDISHVAVGQILSVDPHPDADKLVVCTVEVGGASPITIVTGAANVVPGAWIPVALNGSTLPGGKTIKSGKLRGVLSDGMLCSIEELALTAHDEPDADSDGIFLLEPGDYTPGEDIHTVLELSDTVLDFEITNNRPDCLSIRGLAREAAAMLETPLTLPEPVVRGGGGDITGEVRVSIQEPELCSRYTARMVKNVKIAPSPRWMRRLLRAVGLRPINNIVDITNFVLWEYGQPLHSFDFSCVQGGEILVRRACPGETLETLDGGVRELSADMLVIADAHRPVALAGVMGGANSEITDATSTVLFESANFNGPCVRKTALALSMRTDSSNRFEKGLDSTQTLSAADRACELVELLGCGEVLDGYIDCWPVKPEAVSIPFDYAKINARLGLTLSEAEQSRYLTAVGCTVQGTLVTPPSWRADLRIWEDLSEEVARLYGYDRIGSTLTVSRCTGRLTAVQSARKLAGSLLRGFGYDEMLTYSFVGHGDYQLIGMPEDHPLRDSMTILNPLGGESSVMRTTALPSLARALARNASARNPEALLYELATTYHPSADALPEERENLLFGGYAPGYDFFALKGQIEALLKAFRVKDASFTAKTDAFAYHPGRCAEITVKGEVLGLFGQLHPDVAERLDISAPVMACELRLGALLAAAAPESKYSSLPRYPAIARDLALLADAAMPQETVRQAIVKYAGRLLTDCVLFDVYQGKGVAEGRKSLAYALTFRAADRTLTDDEIDKAIAKLLRMLERELAVTLRQ